MVQAFNRLAGKVACDAHDSEVFACAAGLAAERIGHDLFTIMRFHRTAVEVERLYSSDPDAYPVGGRKPKKDTPWGQHVLTEGRIFTGGEAEIRAAFTDHTTITGLGLRFVANIPLRLRGVTLGTANLLSRSVDYRKTDLSDMQTVAALLAGRLAV